MRSELFLPGRNSSGPQHRVRSRVCRCCRRRGFTLTEVLIVLAIIAVTALILAPDLRGFRSEKLDFAASEIADALRFAQLETLRTGIIHGAAIETNENRLRVFRIDTDEDPDVLVYDVLNPTDRRLYVIDLDTLADTAPAISMGSFSSTFSATCDPATHIAFNARGVPICTAPVSARVLTANLTLTGGGQSRSVTLAPLTGRVTVN